MASILFASRCSGCCNQALQSARTQRSSPPYVAKNRAHTTLRSSLHPRPLPKLVCASSSDVEAPSASTTSSSIYTDEQQRFLWDSVTRALLRLGKAGATDAHARSLSELLAAHKLVKVQINGPEESAGAVAEELSRKCGAVLLQSKGSTLLFGEGGCSAEALLQLARESSAKTKAWREKKNEQRGKRQQELQATTAKREANASRSRRKISGLISQATGKAGGDLSRQALREEWSQVAAGIAAEEAAEEQGPGATAATGEEKRKQPWKRAERSG